MQRTSVLIVGAGPIGLALAGDLGMRDVQCMLVERLDGAISQPKMDMVGVRTMEYCRRWGIVADVESAGYNRDYPQDCAWVTSLNGFELGREVFAPPSLERRPEQSPQKRERCPQNFFDPVLQRFASKWPSVALRYETEFLKLTERPDGVEVVLRDVKSGEQQTVLADYVVGCDGAASKVRETLEIGMTGEGALTFTTNVVFRCDGLEKLHDLKPAYRYIFIGPEGTWATLVAINGRDQWRFSLVGDKSARTYSEEEIRSAIHRAVGKSFDFDILSILPWVRRQLVADSYGSARVFLAGDSAHLTSPTGGFGMNTGIQDAVNLSWKLAGTLAGWGGPGLLHSYEIEQRPVAIRNVTEATANLTRMLSPRVLSPPPEIFGESPAGETAREDFGAQYTELMRREWFSIGIHLGYVYEGSPIIVPDGTPPPPDIVSEYHQTARPGSRAPHIWLGDDVSTLDLFGRDFVLLRLGPNPIDASAFTKAAAHVGLPLSVADIAREDVRCLYGAPLVLVRPDGQVAWRGDVVPANVAAIIDTVRGVASVTDRHTPESAVREAVK